MNQTIRVVTAYEAGVCAVLQQLFLKSKVRTQMLQGYIAHTKRKERCVFFIMRTEVVKRCKTVQAESAAEFDRRFNDASDEHPDAELKWHEGLCVSLIYEERRDVPETVAEEFKLQGITYYCKDCPNMLKGANKRERSHGCKYAEFGTVKDFTPACEYFHKMVLQGKIKPIGEE